MQTCRTVRMRASVGEKGQRLPTLALKNHPVIHQQSHWHRIRDRACREVLMHHYDIRVTVITTNGVRY